MPKRFKDLKSKQDVLDKDIEHDLHESLNSPRDSDDEDDQADTGSPGRGQTRDR